MTEHHHHDHSHHHGSVDQLDEKGAEEIRRHHAAMVADLDRLSADFAARPDDEAAASALQDWFRDVLVPHAAEEEVTTYAAAAQLAEGRLLIDAMTREHVLIRRLVELVGTSAKPAVAAAYGRAVFETFDSHQRKENEIILPLLIGGHVPAHEH